MKAIYYLAFITLLLCTNCCKKKEYQKRYPEDTEDTYDTPMTRIANHWWTLKNVTFNGKDYTDTVRNTLGEYKMYLSEQLESTLQGKLKYVTLLTDIEGNISGVWQFNMNEDTLNLGRISGGQPAIYAAVPCYLRGLWHGNDFLFSILKLSDTELKIKLSTKAQDSTITNTYTSN